MSQPVTVTVPLDIMLAIRQALKECAEDLETELFVRYTPVQRTANPSYMRRFNNDMEVVKSALGLVDILNGQDWMIANDRIKI